MRLPHLSPAILLVVLATLMTTPHVSPAMGGKPRASFRIYFEVSPTLPDSQKQVYQLERPKISVAVGKFPELWEKHVIGVEAMPGQSGAVLFRFDDHGKRVLMFLTEANRGRRMVVVLNGRPIFAPTVDATLPNGQLVVPSGISPKEFIELQKIGRKNKKR